MRAKADVKNENYSEIMSTKAVSAMMTSQELRKKVTEAMMDISDFEGEQVLNTKHTRFASTGGTVENPK